MPKKAKTRTTQEDVLYRLKRAQGLLEQAVRDIERGDRVDALWTPAGESLSDAVARRAAHLDKVKSGGGVPRQF